MQWWHQWRRQRQSAVARRAIARARKAYARGETDAALAQLDRALAAASQDPSVYDTAIALHSEWTHTWTQEDFTRSLDWAMRAQELRNVGATHARERLTPQWQMIHRHIQQLLGAETPDALSAHIDSLRGFGVEAILPLIDHLLAVCPPVFERDAQHTADSESSKASSDRPEAAASPLQAPSVPEKIRRFFHRTPLLGLTGGIGCGKSFVAKCFADHGAAIVDSDAIVHELYAHDQALVAAIAKTLGAYLVDAQYRLDRRALGALVFHDLKAREQLEALVHPIIRERLREAIAAAKLARPPAIVVEIPLLYEAYDPSAFDTVIVVACNAAEQLARVQKRFELDLDGANARISAQIPLAEKRARADSVITTDGTKEETAVQVDALWKKFVR